MERNVIPYEIIDKIILYLPDDKFFDVAYELGRIYILKKFVPKIKKLSIINAILSFEPKKKELNLLNYYFEYDVTMTMINKIYITYHNALFLSNIPILNYLFHEKRYIVPFKFSEIIKFAGTTESLDWYVQCHNISTDDYNVDIFHFATKNRRFDLLDWFVKHKFKLLLPEHHILDAGRRGDVEMLDWWVKHTSLTNNIILKLYPHYHPDTLEWLREHDLLHSYVTTLYLRNILMNPINDDIDRLWIEDMFSD